MSWSVQRDDTMDLLTVTPCAKHHSQKAMKNIYVRVLKVGVLKYNTMEDSKSWSWRQSFFNIDF